MVIFLLNPYEALMVFPEDIEDRLSVTKRLNEPIPGQEKAEEYFTGKFGKK